MKTIVTSLLIFEESEGAGPRRLWGVYKNTEPRRTIGSVWLNFVSGGYVFDPSQGESFDRAVMFELTDFLICLERGDFK